MTCTTCGDMAAELSAQPAAKRAQAELAALFGFPEPLTPFLPPGWAWDDASCEWRGPNGLATHGMDLSVYDDDGIYYSVCDDAEEDQPRGLIELMLRAQALKTSGWTADTGEQP